MTALGRARTPLEVYLQPAVVGGGLGDIEEVLAVGRRLARSGWKPLLYRRGSRPLPPTVDGPWDWPSLRRVGRLAPAAPHALTVTPWWGVSADPGAVRTGRPGPWSLETADIERVYGKDRVVHLSLEEFARTLTSRQQTRERWREGGVAARQIPGRLRGPAAGREVRAFHDAYRKWRAFDRPNVVHLFTGFRPSRSFGREFPEAIQTGPLWPEAVASPRQRELPRRWIWYASPSTSDRLAATLAEAMPPPAPESPPIRIEVRGPRRFTLPPGPGLRWRWTGPASPRVWSRRFQSAELRLVTGSRTLLEAIAVGGPFLYFNGVMNRGSRTRRHRPEKIESLLEVWRHRGVSKELRTDLAGFSRLRGVAAIVRRATEQPAWSARFPGRAAAVEFSVPWNDAGTLLDRWASEWSVSEEPAADFVRRLRNLARPRRSRL
ncbi:MAG: hypothetical protein L3K14_01140 [Thermoplasmata archaeon]|nr:hypothetical protein [Thermoplasmata archaeon]